MKSCLPPVGVGRKKLWAFVYFSSMQSIKVQVHKISLGLQYIIVLWENVDLCTGKYRYFVGLCVFDADTHFWANHLLGDSGLLVVSSNIVSVTTCVLRGFALLKMEPVAQSFHVFENCFAIMNRLTGSLYSEFMTFLMGIVCNVSYKTYTSPVTFVNWLQMTHNLANSPLGSAGTSLTLG
jgi:hypothetical protein